MSFGQQLRQLRRERDLKQVELARRAGCSVDMIRKIESGLRFPAADLAGQFADVLELSPQERKPFLRLARHHTSRRLPDLPAPLTPLVDREIDIEGIANQLRSRRVRLLTLVGPPGVGKTRLSLAVGARLQEAFADGVGFAALAPLRDPALAPDAVARAVGARTSSRDPTESLIEHLRGAELLLILDNFEQILAARGLVADLLGAAPRLTVLATSRQPLDVYGEHLFQVAPLPLASPPRAGHRLAPPPGPAVTLFLDRARAVRPDLPKRTAESDRIVEICRKLDGLPLAIELAAARCRHLSIDELEAGLSRQLDLLSAGPATLPDRQRSLRGALDWSFDLLDDEERRVFAGLGAFVAGAPTTALSPVLETRDMHVPASLVDRSLLALRDGRYEMLDTVRTYAEECLERSVSAAAVRERHARFFLALAEQAEYALRGAHQVACLQDTAREHANLRAAIAWALGAGEDELAVRLCAALWPFWRLHGTVTEGRRWLSTALGRPAPAAARCRALNGAGVLAILQGDYEYAEACLTQSAALAQEVDDQATRAYAISNLGWACHDQGRFAEAEAHFQTGLRLREAIGDRWGEAWSLNNLGVIALGQKEYAWAETLFARSAALFVEVQDRRGESQALSNQGWSAQELGAYVAATELFTRSLALARILDNAFAVPNDLTNLGLMAMYRSDFDAAGGLFEEAVGLYQVLGDRRGIAEVLEDWAGMLGLQQRPREAARLFGRVAELRREINAPLLAIQASRYEPLLDAAREQLDAPSWDRAWDEWRQVPLDDVIERVLEDADR